MPDQTLHTIEGVRGNVGPNALQRNQLAGARRRRAHGALFTDSIVARGMMMAFSFENNLELLGQLGGARLPPGDAPHLRGLFGL